MYPETGVFVHLFSGINSIILHSCSVHNSDSPMQSFTGIVRQKAGWAHMGRKLLKALTC